MSPARLLRPFHLAASLAAFSFAAGADAASPLTIAPAMAISAHEAKTSGPTARLAKHVTSPARSAKALSTRGTAADRAEDFDSRGKFAMQAGQNAEAIAAFEHALKLDPSFTDAWGKLAFLHLREGNSAKAVDAFKKAKLLGDANGGMITRDASGVLLFP